MQSDGIETFSMNSLYASQNPYATGWHEERIESENQRMKEIDKKKITSKKEQDDKMRRILIHRHTPMCIKAISRSQNHV